MFSNFFTVLFLFFSSALFAQTTISGKVLDSRTGNPLPFCTVYFEDKKVGGKSDRFGMFTLKSPKAEAVLYVKHIGYETKVVNIQDGQEITIKLVNQKVTSKNKAIIVGQKLKKDTYAHRLFRLVVKNKPINRPQSFESIQYDLYEKFEASLSNVDSQIGNGLLTKPLKYILEYQNETPDGQRYTPLIFKETFSENFQKGKKKLKKVLKSKENKLTENQSIFQILNYTFSDYDVYDNSIIIANNSFESPISDFGLLFYKYYIEDSSVVDGVKNYKFMFAPRNKEDFGFTGTFDVEEGTWALKSLDMTLDKRANVNLINHLAYSQEFQKIEGKWFVIKDVKDLALSITKNAKSKNKVRFVQSEVKGNIKMNLPLSDDIFSDEEVFFVTGHQKEDEKFWQENRLDTLSTYEAGIYARTDSFKRTSQYKVLKYMADVASSAFFPIPGTNVEVGRAYQFVSWNAFEGTRYRFGLRTSFQQFKHVNIYPYFAYGSWDQKFKYGINIMYNLPRINGRWNQLTFVAKHDYDRMGNSEDLMFFDNAALTLFRWGPKENRLKDIILRDQVTLNYAFEERKGLEYNFSIDRTRYFTNSTYPFVEQLNDGTTFEHEHLTFLKLRSSIRITRKEPVFANNFNRVRLNSIFPIFTINTTIGIKGILQGQYNFLNLNAEINHRLPTFLGLTSYRINAGKVFGKVPYIELRNLAGNNGFVLDNDRFFNMNEGEFTADQWVEFYFRHNFKGFILNKIPLIKLLQLRELVFWRGAMGTVSDQNRNYFKLPANFNVPDPYYMETGVGLSNIFKFFQIVGSWRLTQLDNPNVQRFKIMGNVSFEF
ncbi:MAG: DUF5686 and carboxypeptidase regulatory-like domain-containing protein [Chitinophagales bacterium]|jgi:hypothetical protein|nr:DUF5686 and carboxypeptidase regulatory-like domain-containing protein [Chitinophagales bacterium]